MDVIRKTLLAGVGAAVITKEKVETALEDFVKQGKVTSGEAREMAEKIAAEGKREFEALTHELNERFRERFARTESTMSDRLAALEARVAALERAAGAPTSAGPAERASTTGM